MHCESVLYALSLILLLRLCLMLLCLSDSAYFVFRFFEFCVDCIQMGCTSRYLPSQLSGSTSISAHMLQKKEMLKGLNNNHQIKYANEVLSYL